MIIWKSATISPSRASFRYRVALPAIYLERLGIRSRVAWHPRLLSLRGASAVVFSKTFQAGDLAVARRAHQLGIPIIYDLCDNVFVEGYPPQARAMFGQIADLASVVVTTTAPLAEVAASHMYTRKPFVTIPDPVERAADTRIILIRYGAAAAVEGTLRKINAAKDRLRGMLVVMWRGRRPAVEAHSTPTRSTAAKIVNRSSGDRGTPAPGKDRIIAWFGNHGGDYSDFGMLDLLAAAPALEALARRLPIKLRVISNNATKFREKIEPLRIPTEYVEWHATTIHELVRSSEVVILPSTVNEFTRCKSSNRLLLALSCGVPVVATRSPASMLLEGAVLFDDWEANIERYLVDDALRQAHLARARALIAEHFAPEVIASNWRDALESARRLREAEVRTPRTLPRLVLLINLIQDLELILPIYDRARQRSYWSAELWVTTHDLLKRPDMWRRLESAGVPYKVVEARYAARGGFPGWDGVFALITASESTADPHWHARKTVEIARRHRVRTYTMQHGFQNVGLTYGDERFPVARIRFASDVIFLWGTLESLHPDVHRSTRAKCVPIGCPKPIEKSHRALPIDLGKPMVAVFENLHSARYVDEYRRRFLEDLVLVLRARPDLCFVIKPHPAGEYITRRHAGALELPDNAIVADPRAREWVDITASDILAPAAAVVTSITTVALDAARMNKAVAVAVAGYRRDLAAFAPLTQLREAQEWTRFLEEVVDGRGEGPLERSRTFARKSVLEGDAIAGILDHVGRKSTHGSPAFTHGRENAV